MKIVVADLATVGPTGDSAGVPTVGKWLLAALMIVGRMESLPIVTLFGRESRKR